MSSAMTESPSRYADWKAPSQDGELLVWPAPAQLRRQTLENQRHLASCAVTLQQLPLHELRRRVRAFIGHDLDRPLVATGHQTELFHPGVWVKDVLIDTLASALDGTALHLAVDTDQVKHLHLRWPGVSLPVSDDERLISAAWSALVDSPSPMHLRRLRERIDEDFPRLGVKPMLPEWLGQMQRLSLEQSDLSRALTNAGHFVDWELGLRHHSLLASPLWSSDAFLVFAHHLVAHADRFAGDYNRALDDHRAATAGRDPNRPMPNLLVTADSVELPLWLDDLRTGERSRPTAFRSDAGWTLTLVGGEEFVFDPALDADTAAANLRTFLASTEHRLAPRALTLTTFMRMCVVDQFVHGIGGARYDQVTDRLIHRHFGIEPPRFSVTTATLLFPTALQRERTCIPCVLHQGHRALHDVLGERKRELVAAIATAPRRSRERQQLFFQMHRELKDRALETGLVEQWRQRLDDARHRAMLEQDEFSRELFYVVQPRDRLEQMIERYRDLLASV
jgi:hypothetical protein